MSIDIKINKVKEILKKLAKQLTNRFGHITAI